VASKKLLTTAQAIAIFGQPNQSGSYCVSVPLPFPLRLAWDTDTQVKTIRVHKRLAPSVLAIFTDLLAAYGYKRIVELGIDLFGGCFAFRAMRGGNNWSMHAFAAAIDLDPERNTLKETRRTARFARPEYKAMIDIFYKHGWVSLGIEADYDWMHFQPSNTLLK
jgi:hypothetical protein